MADKLSEAEALKALGKLIEEQNKQAGVKNTGACVYQAGSNTYCANDMTKSQCDALRGIWTAGGRC